MQQRGSGAANLDEPGLQASAERLLALRCALGDPAAWAALVAAHDRRVLRVLLRAVGPRFADELPDLRQEVWARLLASRGAALRGLRAERPGALAAFVSQVALRVAIDFGRSRGLRAAQEVGAEEAEGLPAPGCNAEEAAARRQESRLLDDALEAATAGPNQARDRVVVRAHFHDSLAPAEIAAMGLGLSAKGVETLLYRARERIAARLAGRVELDSGGGS
jgi:RNA polymerase sigma factor (sigma-70 family)